MPRFFSLALAQLINSLFTSPPLSLGSCHFLAALRIFWLWPAFSAWTTCFGRGFGWFWVQVLRLAGVGFATGIARSLGWPQLTQAWQRPLGWLRKDYWDGFACGLSIETCVTEAYVRGICAATFSTTHQVVRLLVQVLTPLM